MVKYGLTPYDALTTATRAPGEFLDEPLGTVRPGTYADLVVLGGDPLADITAAADVRQVMCNGELIDVEVPSRRSPPTRPASGCAPGPGLPTG